MSPADTADRREADAARVRELYALTDPDAGQGDVIDGLVVAAAEAAGVPMATLNLLDADRQCQASTAGFTGEVSPRREAMCEVTVEDGTFVYVPNAAEDPRFADNPWVDGRRGDVRFYAGVPLVTGHGYIIGTLCVFDTEPHHLTDAQVGRLLQLADRVVATFEQGRSARAALRS